MEIIFIIITINTAILIFNIIIITIIIFVFIWQNVFWKHQLV